MKKASYLHIVPKPEPPRLGCGTSLLANLQFEIDWVAREKAKGAGLWYERKTNAQNPD